jgi:hypothetical protein
MKNNIPPKPCLVFVSHAASDSDSVQYLVERLGCVLPELIFFVSSSYKSLKPGAIWWEEIQKNLQDVKVILGCVSRQSINRPWVLFESGIGLGRGGILIPVILDDLPNSKLEPPLSMFQAFRIDDSDGFEHLIGQISESTGVRVQQSLVKKESYSLKKKISASNDKSMGIYIGLTRMNIAVGWVRYGSGNLQFPHICRNFLSFGDSFDNAFRYPPNDTLNAPWQYLGFRIRHQNDGISYDSSICIYAKVKLVDDSTRFIFVSSAHSSWGFTGIPVDEYRVPLGDIPKQRWKVIIVDVQSLEKDFPQPIKEIIGLRVRGGPFQLSHVWCARDLKQIPRKFCSNAKLISYPR